METQIVPLNDIERMAVAFAKSGLFGIKTPEQGVALMLIAQAEGLHPAVAARDYHVIQGRPALKADAMLARFQAAGGKIVWGTYTDTEVAGTFSHPQGGTVTVSWTIAQAKAAGLTGKDVWRQYPRAMLRARVISEGIRTVYPGVSVGVYTVEEVQDMDSKPPMQEVKSELPASAPEMSVKPTQASRLPKSSPAKAKPIAEPIPAASEVEDDLPIDTKPKIPAVKIAVGQFAGRMLASLTPEECGAYYNEIMDSIVLKGLDPKKLPTPHAQAVFDYVFHAKGGVQ